MDKSTEIKKNYVLLSEIHDVLKITILQQDTLLTVKHLICSIFHC